jgi:chromosome partitioning protein
VLAEPEGPERLPHVIVAVSERLHVAPSGIVLSALEQKLAGELAEARTERLARALRPLADRYDYALIDCPPHVGLLTLSALRAADEVIVPLETSHFALHGVHKLLETLELLSERIGHAPAVRVLPTLYDGRTRFARETLTEIRGAFGELCFDTVIRSCVKLREAARRGLPIASIARRSNGSLDYSALAAEVAASASVRTLRAAAEAARRAPPAPPPRPAVAEIPPTLREVVVEFRDPGASDVRIAGDFNGWVPDRGVESRLLEDGDTRVWRKVLRLRPGTYEYRYVVDGEWRTDPANPDRIASPVGPPSSRLTVR